MASQQTPKGDNPSSSQNVRKDNLSDHGNLNLLNQNQNQNVVPVISHTNSSHSHPAAPVIEETYSRQHQVSYSTAPSTSGSNFNSILNPIPPSTPPRPIRGLVARAQNMTSEELEEFSKGFEEQAQSYQSTPPKKKKPGFFSRLFQKAAPVPPTPRQQPPQSTSPIIQELPPGKLVAEASILPPSPPLFTMLDNSHEEDDAIITSPQKKKRKTKKSQKTKALERRTFDKIKRTDTTDLNDVQSTPKGRGFQSRRRDDAAPYPKKAATQPALPLTIGPISNLSAKKKKLGFQIISDVKQPRNDPPASSTLPLPNQYYDPMAQNEHADEQVDDVYVDDDGIFHVNDVYGVPENTVIQIDDVDNVNGGPLPVRNYHDPWYAGVDFLHADVEAALTAPSNSWANDAQLNAFLAGMIPHYAGRTFNRIAFLDSVWDPVFNADSRTPIRSFLRIYPDNPDAIISLVHTGNHWGVLLINPARHMAIFVDPNMQQWQTQIESTARQRCADILNALVNADIIDAATELIQAPPHTFNQQTNGWACGFHALICAEDFLEHGHLVRHPFLNINAERNRITLLLHRLYWVNRNRPDNVSGATVATWTEPPNRRDIILEEKDIPKKRMLAADNDLIKPVAAKPISNKPPKPPVKRSKRIQAQHKPPHPDVVKSKIRSLHQKRKPIALLSSEIYPDEDYQGPMNKRCPHCKAYLFANETSNKCCANGTVPPMFIPPAPPEFTNIARFDEYWTHTKPLNSLFAMVSTSANVQMNDGVFKIQGEPKHNVGDLVPRPGQPQQFAQIYTIDADEALQNRCRNLPTVGLKLKQQPRQEVLGLIEAMLREHHPLAMQFKMMKQQLEEYEAKCVEEGKEVRTLFYVWEDPNEPDQDRPGTANVHPGRLNVPSASGQVFAIYKSDDGGPPPNGLYYGYEKNGGNSLRFVPTYSGRVYAAAYPLIFMYGQPGWTPGIPKLNPNGPPQDQPPPAQQQSHESGDESDGMKDGAMVENSEDDFNVASCSSDDDEMADKKARNVSMNQHFRSQLFDRTKEQKEVFNPITGSRTLTNQYIIDKCLAVEQQRLEYMEKKIEENEWRYEDSKVLRDYLIQEINKDPTLKGKRLGKVRLMTRRYRGGKRYMHYKFHNGIAINRRHGRDDLFITFTGNPTWREILENLRPGETWLDRPDLICRVFNLKAAEFLKDLIKRGVLGKVNTYKLALEHQKRGMPHLHILLSMKKEYKPTTAEEVDDLIVAHLAEQPEDDDENYNANLRYFNSHLKLMIHDPSRCAAMCGKSKKNGICKKGFPKPYSDTTIMKSDGYAQLKRPEDGRTVTFKNGNRRPVDVTNQHVVAHNKYLILKYNCHINVEHCGGIRSLKYLHKYLHKGCDKGFISVRERVKVAKKNDKGAVELDEEGNPVEYVDYNELHQFRQLRVLGGAEAVESTFGMIVAKQSHVVRELPVHLKGEHNVSFKDSETGEEILPKTANDGTAPNARAVSELTAFFKLVEDEKADPLIDQNDETRAPNLYYHQVQEHYHYNKNKWIRRINDLKTIGRLQPVYPSLVERYCLRELLGTVKGPSNYEDLKTFNGIQYATFRESAVAYGLFVDDTISNLTLAEIVTYAMPRQCRQVFALILLYNQPEDAQKLWDAYKKQFLDTGTRFSEQVLERRALAHVASILFHHRKTLSNFKMVDVTDDELMQAINETFSDFDTDGDERYGMLNELQKFFVDVVLHSFQNKKNFDRKRLFFLQASGGTGKTFVFNTLIRILRANGYNVITVASTGIAAILLDGGQTAHSAFRIPLDIHEDARISATHPLAKMINAADCIIWDEAPMQHKSVLERVNKIIKQLCPETFVHHTAFANKTVVLGGDFKQLLPVVRRENMKAAYDASILCSDVFRDNLNALFSIYVLEHNERAKDDPDWAKFLHDVGNGLNFSPFGTDKIQLPHQIAEYSEQAVIDFVYPSEIFDRPYKEYFDWVKESVLVAPINDKVDELNAAITAKVIGAANTYLSIDTQIAAFHQGDEILREDYTTDELNMYKHASIPPHDLVLKERSVVTLTRNLDVHLGLCNGTRMVVQRLFENHVQCQILTGAFEGKSIPIFKITNRFTPEPDEDWPEFSRFQLPLRPAFAITINKSQGQTIGRIGLILTSSCFAHGQLYVALSRVRRRQDIKVYVRPQNIGIDNNKQLIPHATNIVNQQVLKTIDVMTAAVEVPRLPVHPFSPLPSQDGMFDQPAPSQVVVDPPASSQHPPPASSQQQQSDQVATPSWTSYPSQHWPSQPLSSQHPPPAPSQQQHSDQVATPSWTSYPSQHWPSHPSSGHISPSLSQQFSQSKTPSWRSFPSLHSQPQFPSEQQPSAAYLNEMIRRHTQTLRDSASQPSGTQSLLDSIEQRQQQLEDLKQHMESFQLNQQQQHQQQQQQQQQQQPSQSQQPQNSQSQQQQQPQPPPVVPAAPPTTTTLRPPILPKYLAEAMDRYQQEYDKLSDGDQELPSDDDMFL